EEKASGDIQKVSESLRDEQIERLHQVKAKRDNKAVRRTLAKLRECAAGSGNLMMPILACVEVYASVGEISDVLREVWGEYREKVVL
ncbi:MAG: methylmalonyl-CoA mutase, partial [candidate division Zixibacteria bacterium]|nr:methylmalonyl-CoA mutase [candidate division Zixibacteria bacterium]